MLGRSGGAGRHGGRAGRGAGGAGSAGALGHGAAARAGAGARRPRPVSAGTGRGRGRARGARGFGPGPGFGPAGAELAPLSRRVAAVPVALGAAALTAALLLLPREGESAAPAGAEEVSPAVSPAVRDGTGRAVPGMGLQGGDGSGERPAPWEWPRMGLCGRPEALGMVLYPGMRFYLRGGERALFHLRESPGAVSGDCPALPSRSPAAPSAASPAGTGCAAPGAGNY